MFSCIISPAANFLKLQLVTYRNSGILTPARGYLPLSHNEVSGTFDWLNNIKLQRTKSYQEWFIKSLPHVSIVSRIPGKTLLVRVLIDNERK